MKLDLLCCCLSSEVLLTGCGMVLQDPSYDPYGFAKVATQAASSKGGSAARCPSNVQKFFTTLLSLGNTPPGIEQINDDMNLCSDSAVASAADVGNLAQFVQSQWVSAVSLSGTLLQTRLVNHNN